MHFKGIFGHHGPTRLKSVILRRFLCQTLREFRRFHEENLDLWSIKEKKIGRLQQF